jgi:hypothetical protein
MIIYSAANRTARIAAGLALLLAVGCAGLKSAPPGEPPPPATAPVSTPVVELPPASVPEPELPPATAPVSTPVVELPPAPVSEPATATAPAPEAPAAPNAGTQVRPVPAPATAPRPAATKATRSTAAKPEAATVKAQTPAAAQPAPARASIPTPSPAPVAAKQATPPLDLKSLEARLRETKAVGVFTKVSLKNQVDDLLNQFRAYHQRQTSTPLAALRQSYNLLMLKVLTLLQDGDPALARDIVTSREAIWSILADRKKFTESNLMAGAMP